ncbi:type II toxin-antitoxin system PemK/MazF family toxin [Macrococcoides bohemicum]|uniref:type II toxin-antitoxin system PemK/MazF family toxin n=2 Tax=Macrococcoides bohemicum TaxID=1903056 RepID=UPI00105928ED|nr:type II toxin-antitoxin system PemK/MazF family toxin [Macrococcus bohemicus]MBC9873258.1 type II toxin-antitoxin system PemK/MazF family toxin [Macrococcus bohemicus]TDL40494.1 type II toxin-antitoxin system PemK/MazF family toxin [Macrococcus bohemicus]
MVEQGTIIKLDLNPTKGKEQAGYRPALVISNKDFNEFTNLVILCPISSTSNSFPLHINLEDNLVTKGKVLCQHPKTIDLNAREYKTIEKVSDKFINKICTIVSACIMPTNQ